MIATPITRVATPVSDAAAGDEAGAGVVDDHVLERDRLPRGAELVGYRQRDGIHTRGRISVVAAHRAGAAGLRDATRGGAAVAPAPDRRVGIEIVRVRE